jgi:hypothetical protein
MIKRQNRPIPELEIPDYKKYLDWDWDDEDTERLMIPADVLLDLIQRDPDVEEEVEERFLTDDYIDDNMKREFVADLDIREQPEVWKMNASDFKRYLCEILELNYHTTNSEILQVISEKLEGLR